MKKQMKRISGSSVLIGAGMVIVSLSAYGQEAAENHPPLLIASYSQHAAYIVSTNGTVVWES